MSSARKALGAWASWTLEQRTRVLRRFQEIAKAREAEAAGLLRDEVGKVRWDATAEASLLAGKIDVTLEPGGALERVTGRTAQLGPGKSGKWWFRPHGVMAVVGPFNFPMHLPNGHIAPALLMGNTIVFKPSDKAPACGQLLAAMYLEALDAEGAPPGVMNLVHGGADVASALVGAESDVDGVLFTGSWPVGRRIMEASLDRPGRILALEMGGNNAAVIMPDADLRQAVIECVRSAFVGCGQRCTCTRRLIVHEAVAPTVIAAVCRAAEQLAVGPPGSTDTNFMGPLVSDAAARAVTSAFDAMVRGGGAPLLPCRRLELLEGGHFVSAGVLQVERFTCDCVGEDDEAALARDAGADVEVFGPVLRVSVVSSLEEAISQTNATRFGLAASIFTKDQSAAEAFAAKARAGCINWNTGTAGASGRLPFGGLGLSGNHRPAGAFSLDYCAHPVASMVESGNAATVAPGMRFEDSWLA